MSDEHEHHHHDHAHPPDAPVTPEDAGSQALAEALGSSFAIVKIVMVFMVVAFFASGFFTVGPQETAVKLRFGRPVGDGAQVFLSAGKLHWSFPYPIDEVVRIPITQSQTVVSDNGWYMTTPEAELSGEEMPAGQSLNPAIDGYVITADHNIIHTRATLYYHIDNPKNFVFGFTNAPATVRNLLDNALIYTAARFNVDDILARDQAGFRDAVLQRVSDLVEQAQLGIVIDQCDVQSKAPRQLQPVFAEVTTARENRNKLLNDAHTYENQVFNQSGAQATAKTNEAATASANYVKSVTAEARRFGDLLPQYRTNADLFVQQTFVRAVGSALTNVQDKFYLPQRADGKPREVRLQLNREPPQPKTKPGPNP